jgi:tight adherence protein F
MKGISLYSKKQQGVFLVEFTIMIVSLVIFIMFTIDVMLKISMKGKLDRAAYSAVSILKERTQLYDEDTGLSRLEDSGEDNEDGTDIYETVNDSALIYTILKNSFNRTTGNFDESSFGVVVEAQTYANDNSANAPEIFYEGNYRCNMESTLGALEPQLSIISSWGRQVSLYRVSVCYNTDNYVIGFLPNGFSYIESSAVMVGR